MNLTSRERLTRLFRGEPIDRIPIWLLAPYHPLKYYADIHSLDCYRPIVQAIDRHCDTFDRRRPDVGFAYNASPEIQIVPIMEGGRSGTHVLCGKQALESYVERSGGRTRRKFFVTEPEQLMQMLEWPFLPPRPPLEPFRREQAELGERGLLMMDLGDPLEPLYHLLDASDFSMWTLTDLDALTAFTDAMYDRVLALYRHFLENGVGDVFFIVGAEFAGPPLVSPELFGRLCQRYLKGIVDLIRAYGKHSIVHYHGNLYRLLDSFRAVKPDGLHTVEAPPVGDCTIAQARTALGRDTVLIGNIQYDDLIRKTPEDIDRLVGEAIAEGRGGRFILSPTAGPYEEFLSPQAVSNYLAFIDAGIRYGRLDE